MIGAEARGRRRVLFRELGEAEARLRATYRSKRAHELTRGYARKQGMGRTRARRHLEALFGRPRLITDAYLGWLFLAPSVAGVQEDDPDDPGITQDCIAAYALLAGLLPGRRDGSMLACRWSLEFSEHAVGRLLERSPRADPVAAMIAAHDALRRTGPHMPPERFAEFWVPGGEAGAFACRPIYGTMDGTGVVYFRARTWFDCDMMTDQYVVTDAPPGVERFADTIMLPFPLMAPELSNAIKGVRA